MLGLVEHFPLTLDDKTVLVLASALATNVSWSVPFDIAPATELGAESPWSNATARVLRAPPKGHRMWIETTDRAGDVAVHVAPGGERHRIAPGLDVVSVVAAPDVEPARVLAAAYEIASRVLGFTHAAAALIAMLSPADRRYEAKQSAVARYDRTGFEAGAVTGLLILTSATARPAGPVRVATLRFGHPYAVVAVASDAEVDEETHDLRRGPWDGVPVFAAWVAEPDDVEHP